MFIGDYVIWFLVWVMFPVFTYIAAMSGLYVAFAYGGWLFASLAYGLGTWVILWMVDGLGRVSTVDLSSASLIERYIKPLEFAWPGKRGDQARLRLAKEVLTRFVGSMGTSSERPMYFGRYAEIETFPGQILASEDLTQYIALSFGPKWHAWAEIFSLFVWPVSVPLAFVLVNVYGLYRHLTEWG